jgi:hypothetical protein
LLDSVWGTESSLAVTGARVLIATVTSVASNKTAHRSASIWRRHLIGTESEVAKMKIELLRGKGRGAFFVAQKEEAAPGGYLVLRPLQGKAVRGGERCVMLGVNRCRAVKGRGRPAR